MTPFTSLILIDTFLNSYSRKTINGSTVQKENTIKKYSYNY